MYEWYKDTAMVEHRGLVKMHHELPRQTYITNPLLGRCLLSVGLIYQFRKAVEMYLVNACSILLLTKEV